MSDPENLEKNGTSFADSDYPILKEIFNLGVDPSHRPQFCNEFGSISEKMIESDFALLREGLKINFPSLIFNGCAGTSVSLQQIIRAYSQNIFSGLLPLETVKTKAESFYKDLKLLIPEHSNLAVPNDFLYIAGNFPNLLPLFFQSQNVTNLNKEIPVYRLSISGHNGPQYSYTSFTPMAALIGVLYVEKFTSAEISDRQRANYRLSLKQLLSQPGIEVKESFVTIFPYRKTTFAQEFQIELKSPNVKIVK